MIIFLIFTGALFIYILFRLVESFILRKKKEKISSTSQLKFFYRNYTRNY